MNFILHENYHILATFKTLQGARISFNRKWKKRYPKAVIDTREVFNKEEPMVETTNLLSGKKLMIKASEKGSCCDVGTERYWSM